MKKDLFYNEDLVFTNLKIYMMQFQCCHFITKKKINNPGMKLEMGNEMK